VVYRILRTVQECPDTRRIEDAKRSVHEQYASKRPEEQVRKFLALQRLELRPTPCGYNVDGCYRAVP